MAGGMLQWLLLSWDPERMVISSLASDGLSKSCEATNTIPRSHLKCGSQTLIWPQNLCLLGQITDRGLCNQQNTTKIRACPMQDLLIKDTVASILVVLSYVCGWAIQPTKRKISCL